MILTDKNNPKKQCVVPAILPSIQIEAPVSSQSTFTKPFSLFESQFASLAQNQPMSALRPLCLDIDIAQEISLLAKESALEITVPMLGITDLLQTSSFSNNRHFACPIAINGYCAKSLPQESYPHPEFVLITDLMGNQYEIVIDSSGKIELPQEGMSLFSIISSITFIYASQQIKEGAGFQKMEAAFNNDRLLLLSPEINMAPFDVRVCVTHINDRNQRIVDTIRTINVKYPSISKKHYQSNVVVQRASNEKLNITLSLSLSQPLTKHLPYTTSVAFEELNGVQYSLLSTDDTIQMPQSAHGWSQHPVHGNIFTKHSGLSEKALKQLVRNLYSEYDFIQDYLKGDSFTLFNDNDFNNFLLIPEAFGQFYDMLIHDLIHQKIPAEFLFDRISKENILALNVDTFAVDLHDSIVLSQLKAELQDNNIETLKSLFLSEKGTSDPRIIESYPVYAQGLGSVLPQVAIDVTPIAAQQIAHETKDITQMRKAKRQSAWTPLKAATKPVSFNVTQVNGEQFEANNQPAIEPFTVVQIDPSRIHTR